MLAPLVASYGTADNQPRYFNHKEAEIATKSPLGRVEWIDCLLDTENYTTTNNIVYSIYHYNTTD